MKLLFAILFFTAILTSCKKSSDDDYYTITGVVLDWDSKAPIAGAKVYAGVSFFTPALNDSAITDANGKVSFKYKWEDGGKALFLVKAGYINPSSIITMIRSNSDRTDTLYLARASYLNVNIHRVNSYPNSDTVVIWLSGYRVFNIFGQNNLSLTQLYQLKRVANAADTIINVESVYFAPPYQKAYLNWDIVRNGSILSTQSDSTDLIQFGTKNYSLNY